MSLKTVHLVFVTALTALTFGSGVWLLHDYFADRNVKMRLWLGCASLVASVAVVIYGRYVYKKLKKSSYL